MFLSPEWRISPPWFSVPLLQSLLGEAYRKSFVQERFGSLPGNGISEDNTLASLLLTLGTALPYRQLLLAGTPKCKVCVCCIPSPRDNHVRMVDTPRPIMEIPGVFRRRTRQRDTLQWALQL
jgi:hypothetical protein